jgi:hypothetical protein
VGHRHDDGRGDALAGDVAQAREQPVRAERQDVVEVAAHRRRWLGCRVDLNPRQDGPHPRQQVVLHLRRQLHLGAAGGIGELLAVRERVLDQGARLLGDGHGLQRQRQVELVPAGARQIIEREDLILAVN